MNISALSHDPVSLSRQPIARNRVRFTLTAADGDLRDVAIRYFKRSDPEKVYEAPMTLYASDGLKAQWTAVITFPEPAHYIKYSFRVTDRNYESLWYCERGLSKDVPTDGFFELLQVNDADLPDSPAWSRGIIYYQIFPERYANSGMRKQQVLEPWDSRPTRDNYLGGDLRGILQKLPYLRNLGVEALYINPIFKADFNHKYATTDYFSVDPDFGTAEDLRVLVREAHKMGIRILLDGVFNHCGIHFAPFEDLVRNGENSRYVSWFYPKRFPIAIDPECYECVGDYPYMPRLCTHHPEVRAFILKVMRFWMKETGIDGWRLDVADELDPYCIRDIRESMRREYPDALLLGETWGDAGRLVNGAGKLDCAMNYLFRDTMVDFFARRAIDETELHHRLEHMRMKYPPETMHRMYNLLGSHDTARFLTECGEDRESLKLAMAFQSLYPGSPAIYYGDESGMTGENDPGCRGGMDWIHPDTELTDWQRQWNRFRREHSAIRCGAYRTVLADPANHLFILERSDESETIRAAFNSGDVPQVTDFAEWKETAELPPRSVKIIIRGGSHNA